MQRSLAYALAPAPGLPLRFLLAAPWFGVLAALVLFAGAGSAFVSRWSAPTLAATHLLTLGYLSMTMAGSILQLIPVVTGVALPVGRAAAMLAWSGLALGAVLLASALGLQIGTLFAPAALLLAAALAILATVIGRALWRPATSAALPMVRAMRLALGALLLTAASGTTLAFAFGGLVNVPILRIADLHAAWGLLGWVAMLVMGVAFQVIPMFQSTRLYPAPVARWTPPLLAALLAMWSAGWLGAAPLSVLLTAFAAGTGWLLTTRKRQASDATTRYWQLSLASLAASAALALAPGVEGMALLAGIGFIGGFAMSVVNGMLYKIVPFLLWYHLQHDPRATRGQVPSIRQILPDRLAQRQFRWHAAALGALLGAVLWPAWLGRPAALLLAVSCLLLALDLWRAARRCQAIQARFQPS